MALHWDPSHDADRYFAQQDADAEAEIRFFSEHRGLIATIAAGMFANPNIGGKLQVDEIIKAAGNAAEIIVSRGQPIE